MASPDGWLGEGHGLDLTMLATAANFETRTNGATHMGNDDATIFDGLAHLQIVDVSCPQQMLSLMKWTMEGNRGLLYVRVMRTPSAVIYGSDYVFEIRPGPRAARERRGPGGDRQQRPWRARGASLRRNCASAGGISVGVVDMPSIDEDLLVRLCETGRLVCLAEQNNGFILQNLLKVLYRRGLAVEHQPDSGDQHARRRRQAAVHPFGHV